MGSKAPAAPDYAAAAQAQGAANVETARTQSLLNNPNTYTPYGSQVWTDNGDGRPTLTQTLSPDEAQKLGLSDTAQIGALQALANLGPANIAKALQSGNFTLPGTPAQDFDPRFAPQEGIQTDSGFWSLPGQQEDVNLAAAPAMPTADAATRQMVTKALYDQGASFLDPQFAQAHQQQNSDLSNQGIFMGSDAYNTAQDNLARQEQQAYGDLRDRAILQGGNEMAQDFNLGMSAHNQGVNDILNAGTFHNTSRGQEANQLETDMQNKNAALTTNANLGSMGSSLYNSGRSQQLQENAQGALLPINAQSAILTGSQVNNPQFQPYNNNVQVQPPPLYQAAQDQGNYNINTFNANQGTLGNFLNAGAKIGSAYIMS